MHIIHHLEGRELLFMLPFSDQEVFHNVEEKIYRVIGSMLAHGFPITEFIGGRKNKDSLYTKLLSKQETVAAQIYDKLRFRIVTRSADDIFPVIQYLSKRLFPFNYVIPGQSINSIFHFRNYCRADPHLAPMLPEMQAGQDDETTPSDNRFSAADVSGHPFRGRYARAFAAQAPRARPLERLAARAHHLRRLRIPGDRSRHGGCERTRRSVRTRSTRSGRSGR